MEGKRKSLPGKEDRGRDLSSGEGKWRTLSYAGVFHQRSRDLGGVENPLTTGKG